MRRRSRTLLVALALVILVGALVFFLVGSSGTPFCQAEADRVAAAMADPLGPTPSLAGLTPRDAKTVRTFRSAFLQAYNAVSGPDKVAVQQRVIVRWNTFIIPHIRISTRQEYGCK